MGELWRDLVDVLRQRPLLWLPVLLADLLGYLINLGRTGLLHLLVVHETSQHSVLGGTAVRTPMSTSAMQSTSIIALLLTWLTYFFRIALYSTALIAIAALVQAYRERRERPAGAVRPALADGSGGILDLSLRALSVYAVAALLFGWLSPFLANHGQKAILRNAWFGYGLTLVLLLALSFCLPPAALRVLAGRRPDARSVQLSRLFSLVLALVASLLAAFVASNARELTQVPLAARYPLEIIGSLLVALPYVLLFTGLSLLARQVARQETEPGTAA